jgi:hypothetical protein
MTTVPGRGLAVPVVAAALVLSVVVGGLTLVMFLRDVVHFQCDYSDVGESAPGSFFCSDGNGYILPVIDIFFVWTVVYGVAVVAMSAGVPPAVRPRLLGLVSLAPMAYLSKIAAEATSRLRSTVQPHDFWTGPMLAATVLLAAFAVVALALLAVPRGSARTVLYIAGGTLLLVGIVAQPGMVSAAIVSSGVFGASFILDRARFESVPVGSTGPSRRAAP